MRVPLKDLESCIESLQRMPFLSLDSETTGLRPFHGDRLFALSISSGLNTYYFDFKKDLSHVYLEDYFLPLWKNPNITWFLHNAKFDLHFFKKEGVEIAGTIHDTMAIERLVENDAISYSLAAVAKKYGMEKSEAVEEHISKNALWDWQTIPGKKQRKKNKYYERVPDEIMSAYAIQDALITYKIGREQLKLIKAPDPQTNTTLERVYENELKLTKALLHMERGGLLLDRAFCMRAKDFEVARQHRATEAFYTATGQKYQDSTKLFQTVFAEDRARWKFTDKNNPSFDADALRGFESPVANLVLEYKDAKSRADFYNGFLYHADANDIIHPNLLSGGAATGRLSSSEPNFQNLTDDSEAPDTQEFRVRRAVIPRPGNYIVSIDYKSMEYVALVSYANETGLIAEMDNGVDIHAATAKMMGVDRRTAKTINFMLLYGGGIAKLCIVLFKPTYSQKALEALLKQKVYKRHLDEAETVALGAADPKDAEFNLAELEKARALKLKYFSTLPRVQKLIEEVIGVAKSRGFIMNWLGRRSRFESGWEYKAPNSLIQGGCADITKLAICRLHEYLKEKKSLMILTVHDEVIFDVPARELWILPILREIMEDSSPFERPKLRASISLSNKSLGDLVEWQPEKEEIHMSLLDSIVSGTAC